MWVQDMLASWSQPYKDCYGVQQGAHYYELSFVESAVCQTTSPLLAMAGNAVSMLLVLLVVSACEYQPGDSCPANSGGPLPTSCDSSADTQPMQHSLA